MKFTVEYIPLSKIKPGTPSKMTQHLKALRRFMWDCMHLLAVRKNRKDGSYTVISGQDQYDHLMKHTNKKYAPCIVEKEKASAGAVPVLTRLHIKQLLNHESIVPGSWSIIRAFLKQDHRFHQLSRTQQLKVLLLAVCYKKTVLQTMKHQVDVMMSRNKPPLQPKR